MGVSFGIPTRTAELPELWRPRAPNLTPSTRSREPGAGAGPLRRSVFLLFPLCCSGTRPRRRSAPAPGERGGCEQRTGPFLQTRTSFPSTPPPAPARPRELVETSLMHPFQWCNGESPGGEAKFSAFPKKGRWTRHPGLSARQCTARDGKPRKFHAGVRVRGKEGTGSYFAFVWPVGLVLHPLAPAFVRPRRSVLCCGLLGE